MERRTNCQRNFSGSILLTIGAGLGTCNATAIAGPAGYGACAFFLGGTAVVTYYTFKDMMFKDERMRECMNDPLRCQRPSSATVRGACRVNYVPTDNTWAWWFYGYDYFGFTTSSERAYSACLAAYQAFSPGMNLFLGPTVPQTGVIQNGGSMRIVYSSSQ